MPPDPLEILVAEDEPVVLRRLVSVLTRVGHRVEVADDGRAALERGTNHPFDLVLLDSGLSPTSGIDVGRRLRQVRPGLPILFLTRVGAVGLPPATLRGGMWDAVERSCRPGELLERVDCVGRLAGNGRGSYEVLEIDDCRLELGRCRGRRGSKEVTLTMRECGILRWLYRNRGRAVSRAELLEEVWGVPGDLRTRTVDMTISNLRRKIEATPSRPRIVVTVKGQGYAWGGATA